VGTDSTINVCHLISGDLWAGAEVQMHTLVLSLAKSPRLSLSAIVLNEGLLAERLRADGIDVTVIEESRHGFFSIVKKVAVEVSRRGTDILHTHRYKENILGAKLKKRGRVKRLIQTVHGLSEPHRGIKKIKAGIFARLNERFTARYFDIIMPVSDDIARQLERKYGRSRLVTIHNGISLSATKPARTREQLRKEFGIPEGAPVIGAAGRMVPVKGYDLFIEMAVKVLEKLPSARFLIIGDGPLRQSLEDKVTRLGLADRVILPGFRNDIIDALNCLDLFVISSFHEGIPMVLLEAMALRRPIVATTVGGIGEIIQDDISGALVASGDSRALAEACLKVLESGELGRRLGDGARARIECEFNVEIQAKRVLGLYEELAGMA